MSHHQKRRTYLLSAVVVSLLTACGSSGPDGGSAVGAQDVDDFGLGAELVAAAQVEGSLVLATKLAQDTFGELSDTFEDRYGIEVQLESPGAAETVERVRTASRSGQAPSYDAAVVGGFALEQLAQEELLTPFVPQDFASTTLLSEDSEQYFPLVANVYGIGVNRSVLEAESAEPPASWADLRAAQADVPVLVDDPTTSAGYIWFATMLDAQGFGEPFLTAVGGNEQLRVGSVLADNISQLVRGEVGVYYPVSTHHIESDFMGTDVEFVTPAEGPVVIPINAGVVEGAAHPNAAKLWLSFLWSSDGQRILAEDGRAPVRRDAVAPDPRWDLNRSEPAHQVTNSHLLDQLSVLEAGLPAQLGIG